MSTNDGTAAASAPAEEDTKKNDGGVADLPTVASKDVEVR